MQKWEAFMLTRLAILAIILVASCGLCGATTTTWLWDDFNGSYAGGFNGYMEQHFKTGDWFATHYYKSDPVHTLSPHTGSNNSAQFLYYKYPGTNGFVTYFETMSYTDPNSYQIDLVGLLALRGQDPIDQTQPITYRVHVYGHNHAVDPDNPAAYWKQMLEVQMPNGSVKKAAIYWTGANNDTWQTLEVTQTGLDGGHYQWLTFDSWYPGAENNETNYFTFLKDDSNVTDPWGVPCSGSFMNWENLEIDYTPQPPLFSNLIVVADSNDIPGFFYVENEARTFGVRCHYLTNTILVPQRGDRVNLWGVYERLLPDKILRAQSVKILSSGNAIPTPLGMGVKCAGGRPNVALSQGPLNSGVLARIAGRITYVGTSYVYVDDGSKIPYGAAVGATGMKVYTTKTGLQVGRFISATGMIGLEYMTGGKMPILQTRNLQDFVVVQ